MQSTDFIAIVITIISALDVFTCSHAICYWLVKKVPLIDHFLNSFTSVVGN